MDNAAQSLHYSSRAEALPTTSPNDVIADWEVVKKYHPNAEAWRVDLSKLSQSLAFAFQITVLEKKLASNRNEVATIATNMKTEFLQRYFGTNPDIQRFARDALREGRSDVAKEVNRAIKILGTPPDNDTARRFIYKVQNSMEYDLREPPPLDLGPIAWIAILFSGVIGVFLLWGIIAAHH